MAPEDPGRHVTDGERDPRERYSLYRLCECTACGGSGKAVANEVSRGFVRCTTCRGEGKQRDELAACETPEAVGVALVTLAREGEWRDENGDPCALGLLDRQGAKGQKWLILPWKASARNVSTPGACSAPQVRDDSRPAEIPVLAGVWPAVIYSHPREESGMDIKTEMIEAFERGDCGYAESYDYVRERMADQADLLRKQRSENAVARMILARAGRRT